jgi:hypothetical protein
VSGDREGQMGKAPMGTRYAIGIILTFIILGAGFILTRGMLSDPNFGGVIGTAADRENTNEMLTLAVWGGIIVAVSGLCAAI